MTNLQKGIITLIRSALTNEKLTLPDGFSIEAALPQLKRHQIAALCHKGAVLCGVPKDSPTMQNLFRWNYRNLLKSEAQCKTIGEVCSLFEEQNIDYMLMKGCNLKELYPSKELRQMADADILIKQEQYPKIKSLIENLGYKEKVGSDHAYIWYNDALVLELHKSPVPLSSPDYDYFGDGWAKAKQKSGRRYVQSPEDEYIFIFAHYAKHYRLGGIGCRQVTDLWVFMQAFPNMDFGYIEAEIEKLGLLEFYKNTIRMLSAWFEDTPHDDITLLITDFIFESGSWGTKENIALSKSARFKKDSTSVETAKAKHILRLFFPTAASIEGRYRVLAQKPWLLPFYWVVRWVDILKNRPKNVKYRFEETKLVNDENMSEYESALRKVGLK